MRRLLMILVLTLKLQATASFLDSPGSINNPAQWQGSAWYCVDYDSIQEAWYITAGPFSQWVDCDAY